MNRDALLPCPFCGGEAQIINISEGENAGGSCVECKACHASSNVEFEFKENFVSNWNTRALPVGGGVEEGMVLVPREPTEAIILAIAGCKLDEVRLTIAEPSALIVGLKNAPSIWQSIIAALSPRSADGLGEK